MYYYRRCIARKAFYISIITPSICLLVTCGQMLGTFRSDDASSLEADWRGGLNSKDCPFKAAACKGKRGGKKKKDNRSCLLFLGAPAGHKEEDVPDQTWQCSRETSGINPETSRQPFPPPQVSPNQTPTISFPHVNLVTYRLPSLIPPCCRSIPVPSHRCPRKGL